MRHTAATNMVLCGLMLAGRGGMSAALAQDAQLPPGSAPRAVAVARTTTIPRCTLFVDVAVTGRGDGTAQRPHKTIAAAVAGADQEAVICVAEGTYPEQLKPGEKSFTLAGGFQRGRGFKVRDSATYATKATGNGSGSFIRIEDPGPKGRQLTAIDGFDISGDAQGRSSAIIGNRSVSTSPTITSTTTTARTTSFAAEGLPCTMSRVESKVMCSEATRAVGAEQASSTTIRKRTLSGSNAISSTTTRGQIRPAPMEAASISRARR
jgi:Protein of unknown function (DUF1565)